LFCIRQCESRKERCLLILLCPHGLPTPAVGVGRSANSALNPLHPPEPRSDCPQSPLIPGHECAKLSPSPAATLRNQPSSVFCRHRKARNPQRPNLGKNARCGTALWPSNFQSPQLAIVQKNQHEHGPAVTKHERFFWPSDFKRKTAARLTSGHFSQSPDCGKPVVTRAAKP